MKKSLLVTLADRNYIDQAKQLFSSLYHNAGWGGDYMLLAHEIPEKELKWFEDNGILVRRCEPLYESDFGGMPATLTSKFYLFTPEFRRWKNIVYLDADIIVNASLDKMAGVKGFAAVPDTLGSNRIRLQMIDPKYMEQRGINPVEYNELKRRIKNQYGLSEHTFCAGVFSFSTDIISEDTFLSLKKLTDKYKDISAFGDQLVFNLFFYRKWKKLPCIYNAYFPSNTRWFNLYKKAALIHFIGRNKPWFEGNNFYGEWRRNMEMAYMINLKNRPNRKKMSRVSMHMIYLNFIYWKNYIRENYSIYHMTMGHIGSFMKRRSPRLYRNIKNVKDGIHDTFIG